MSNFIKFSTLSYYKLKDIVDDQPVILLEVFQVSSVEGLSKSFLDYDTKYKDDQTLIGDSHFKIPKSGSLLVLLFIDERGRLFTTIRSRYGKSGDKYTYYRSKRNCHFWIERVSE